MIYQIRNDQNEYFVAMSTGGSVIFSRDPRKAMNVDQSQINGLMGNIYLRVPADVQLFVAREIEIKRAA